MKLFVGEQKTETVNVAPTQQVKTELNAGETVSKVNHTRSYVQDQYQWATEEKATQDKYKARSVEVANIESDTLETWTAAFEETNALSAWVASTPRPDVEDVPGYSPFTTDENGKSDLDGFEKYADAFSDSFNPQTTAVIKSNIRREERNKMTLANGGALGVAASVAAGVVDPINLSMMLLPGYGQANVWKVMGESMAIGAVASTAQELVLHSSQETRTLEESIFNIGVGAVVDGLFGGAIHALTRQEKEVVTNAISRHLKGEEPFEVAPRDVGAAQTASYGGAKGEEVMPTYNPVTHAGLALSRITPIGRTLQSDDVIVRATAQDMVDHNIRLKGDPVNAVSVESKINLDYAKVAIAEQTVNKIESAFIKEGGTLDDFNFQLADAMRTGDKSTNKHVQSAVTTLRKEYDTILKRAADAEVEGTFKLNKDGDPEAITSTTSASYLSRRKDINAIRNDPAGYQKAWIDGLKERQVRYEKAAIEEGLPAPKPKTDEEWDVIAADIYNRDINLTSGELHFNDTSTKIPSETKARVDILDSYLNDFLVKDWRSLLDGYARSMIPKSRMAEKFGTYKLGELEERLTAKLKVSSAKITAEIKAGADPKKANAKLKKLQKQNISDIKDLSVMARRLMNEVPPPTVETPVERMWHNSLRTTRAFNVASMLGNVLVASIPDVARQITYNGSYNYIKALSKNFNAKSIRLSGISKDEMGRLAQAIEKTQSIRAKEVTMVDDAVAMTPLDRRASMLAQKSLQLTGFQHWNSFGKGISGSLYGDRLSRALIDGGDTRKLNQLGFDAQMIREMSVQAKQHSTKTGALYDLNLDLWDIDIHLRENIEAAGIKESNFLVTTPGAGDTPILMDGNTAKSVFQFQSFALAATNRIMLPLLQENSTRSVKEMVTHMLLGYAAYELKSASMGRDTSKDTVKDKTWNAINHTGLIGYGSEVYRRQFGFTGIDPLGVMENDRKYASRGIGGAMLGPSAGTFTNMWRANPLNTMQTSEQKAKAARRLLPLQNNWLLRHGADQVEKAIAQIMPNKTK
jgi:hypothetical protein